MKVWITYDLSRVTLLTLCLTTVSIIRTRQSIWSWDICSSYCSPLLPAASSNSLLSVSLRFDSNHFPSCSNCYIKLPGIRSVGLCCIVVVNVTHLLKEFLYAWSLRMATRFFHFMTLKDLANFKNIPVLNIMLYE